MLGRQGFPSEVPGHLGFPSEVPRRLGFPSKLLRSLGCVEDSRLQGPGNQDSRVRCGLNTDSAAASVVGG